MTIIKTLGPDTTDSYRAACVWANENRDKLGDFEIKGYPRMEYVFKDLAKADLIVMPVGFTDRDNDDFSSWVDYHYYYSNKLEIAGLFPLDTMEMILVENLDYKYDRAIVQSSTIQLLKRNGINCSNVDFSPSKSYALMLFNEMDFRYVICSSSDYEAKRSDENKAHDRIIERTSIRMIWVVYRVK